LKLEKQAQEFFLKYFIIFEEFRENFSKLKFCLRKNLKLFFFSFFYLFSKKIIQSSPP